MKTGIIGLPQVGKTSLFKILTKADISNRTYANPREAHIGVATVPGSSFYNDKKDGRGFVRFAFCKKFETMKRAADRLARLPRIKAPA